MVTRTVSLKDFSKVIGEDWKIRKKEYFSAVVAGIIDSLPEVIKNSPIDTGEYAQSWDLSIDEERVLFGNFAPHAGIIEFGARPFKPPLGPLLAWAKRVLRDASQPPNFSSRVWALAKYTQAKIEREGMKPRHIMEQLIPTIISNISQALRSIK